jgi:hypothetical protein
VWAATGFDGDDALTVVVLVLAGGSGLGREAYAGRALFLVKNSQSSRVKMSFVTAAIEKRVRRRLHSASISAVLPEPTGLYLSVSRTGACHIGPLLLKRVSHGLYKKHTLQFRL